MSTISPAANQSLHYTVKAFLFSAPLTVERSWQDGRLTSWALSAEFKFPPGLGKKRRYQLAAEYSLEDVQFEQTWGDKVQDESVPLKDQLDLARYFWEPGYAGQVAEGEHQVLWIRPEVTAQVHEHSAGFTLKIHRRGSLQAEAEGSWGGDGVLNTLKLTVAGLSKLGVITLQKK